MIEVEDLGLGEARLIRFARFPDNRGWFSETFNDRWLAQLQVGTRFVQDNMSWSERLGTLRGLHAQRRPMAQAKLVSVVAGAIFDVIVDCRSGSATYGRSRSVVLAADQPRCLYAPAGFCHGFLTLEPGTLVAYKVDNYYSREHETGLRWNDPKLAIQWPLDGREPIMTEKDRALPLLAEFEPL
jgi:dTDP-4-dehydrorhamnose 3,5-epimerase